MLATLLEKIKGAIQTPACFHCHQSMSTAEALFCLRCHNKLGLRDPYSLVHTRNFESHAATLFNPLLKKLLYSYKFYGQRHLSAGIADILVAYWSNVPRRMGVDAAKVLVVTIPSHGNGESHMQPVARRFAEQFGYKLYDQALVWDFATEPQHRILQKRRRIENVRNAMGVLPEFFLRLPYSPELVIVLDDLTTTGATLFEATQAFHRAPGFKGQTLGLALCSMPLAFQKHLIE